VSAFLLDVNVLVALIDPVHVQHDAAHNWFAHHGAPAWATCPLTENGVVRIVSHPRYPGSPGPPAAIAALISRFCALPGHVFWPDDISLLDSRRIDSSRLLGHGQVTDSYLLALAHAHGGKLATFDRRLVTSAVRGGTGSLHVIE
jgi:toxin-antitoxin system PIN domain toxin